MPQVDMTPDQVNDTRRRLDDLTVFVISTGEETEADCVAALEAQNCTFRIEHIRGVTPMSAAFQAMPDRAQTPYFLQVDADMILNPDAVSALYDAVRASPFWVYRVAGTLYEEGFGIGGAVKCWKKSFFRFFRFHDVRTVDRDLHARAARWGLKISETGSVVGVHRPRHSDFSLYLKTKSDVEKWRFLKRPADRFALPLLEEILAEEQSPAPRLLGVMLGALTGPTRLVRSKDAAREQRCLDAVTAVLGQSGNFTLRGPGRPEINDLRPTFVRAYDTFRGTDASARSALSAQVLRLFGATESAQEKVAPLLAAIDQ